MSERTSHSEVPTVSPGAAQSALHARKLDLILIVGPTAVGKSAVAIDLAERIGAEIISADSRLFYRGMDIGTAKSTRADRARVPHHLIDIVDPDETISLGQFQSLARGLISDIAQRGNVPILVGGTGQYVRAVTEGWLPPPVSPDAALRASLEALNKRNGRDWLHEKLGLLDRPAAEAIDPRNVRRTIRALEVIFSTGRRFSDLRSRAEPSYRLIGIGLRRPRSELYARIDARIDEMFELGLVDEVQALISRYDPSLPALSAIGYREVVSLLGGEITLEAARAGINRRTRAFVRRQANWFKETDPALCWFDAAAGDLLPALESFLDDRLTRDAAHR